MAIVDIRREGPIAVARYDRGGKANALNEESITALIQAADELSADDSVQVVILTGTESRFSGGVDLTDENLWRVNAGAVTRHTSMSLGGVMCDRWRLLPQITIAAVEGPAIGGGGILALATDFRVMAEGAFFQFPEVRLGMTLGWGGLPLLSSLIGPTRAKHALFANERIGGQDALHMGLCDKISPAGGAVETAKRFAQTIAECPPMGLRMTKRAIDQQHRANWAASYEADQFYLARLIAESSSQSG
ncbi:enoyl-CoA hydratase/isomerase family protein [Brucella intermedia]|uniref:enoyl-CoA hydratase/isomerase family protein n=1 Tax=Brucella intermedia TaxID=94625 RepID=UPI00124DA2EA|nr:enoyl-CoA hydratase/isomerase family protein [Brucella intermedia]KAB2711390.1 enoyl-CoA hydratase/isomerase family protein [Brucella intermedia]